MFTKCQQGRLQSMNLGCSHWGLGLAGAFPGRCPLRTPRADVWIYEC